MKPEVIKNEFSENIANLAAFLLVIVISSYMPMLGLLLFIWAIAVSCSRVILGVHFPADLLAGICLAISSAQFAQLLLFNYLLST